MPKKKHQTPELDKPNAPELPPPARSSSAIPKGPTVVRADAGNAATKRKFPWLWVGVGVLVLAAVTSVGFLLAGPKTDESAVTTNTQTNTSDEEQLVPRVLDGVLATAARSHTNLYAIMIENATDSRPPSALDKASVVYEALAEGGITRFMALYPLGDSIEEIGPVRSARRYYLDWAEEYKPLYAHVGGSPDALDYLKSGKANILDFNQFYRSSNFWRDRARPAPHNVYTSTDKLFIGLRAQAPNFTPTYTSWLFKEEPGIEARPEVVTDLVVDFSSVNYKAIWKYNRGENRYQRFHNTAEHLTRAGEKIFAKNVIVQFTPTSRIPRDTSGRLRMETIGEGRAVVVRDGVVVEGTWKKASATSRTQFLDATGQPIALNPGPIWIEIVPTDRPISF